MLARGIDVKDIAVVINYDFPPAVGGQLGVESYVHRIGRTGRQGGTGRGKAYTFFTEKDAKAADGLVAVLQASGQKVPALLRALAGRSSADNMSCNERRQQAADEHKKVQRALSAVMSGKAGGGGGKAKLDPKQQKPGLANMSDEARAARIAANRAKAAKAESTEKRRKQVQARIAQAGREEKLQRAREYGGNSGNTGRGGEVPAHKAGGGKGKKAAKGVIKHKRRPF
eukprot:SAG22_NODE_1660_length_3870_cov_3.165208_2_plen_228_part_00